MLGDESILALEERGLRLSTRSPLVLGDAAPPPPLGVIEEETSDRIVVGDVKGLKVDMVTSLTFILPPTTPSSLTPPPLPAPLPTMPFPPLKAGLERARVGRGGGAGRLLVYKTGMEWEGGGGSFFFSPAFPSPKFTTMGLKKVKLPPPPGEVPSTAAFTFPLPSPTGRRRAS